jgi:hypothetical protein
LIGGGTYHDESFQPVPVLAVADGVSGGEDAVGAGA